MCVDAYTDGVQKELHFAIYCSQFYPYRLPIVECGQTSFGSRSYRQTETGLMRIVLQARAEEAAMRSATTTAIPAMDESARSAQRSSFARFGGVAIAALVPAVFWSFIIELGSLWLGMPLASSTIVIVGAAIALFLFAVCAPLMLRKPDTAATSAEVEVRASKSSA
jgi:hypothetical protein